MILNRSAHVFLNLNKNNKQSLKIYPGTQRKLGMLNVIKQLQHFILCNIVQLMTFNEVDTRIY
jgi:hypothetical protein